MVYFPIAEYRPDVAGLNTNYSSDIKNVFPDEEGYIPIPSIEKYSEPYAQSTPFKKGSEHIYGWFSVRDLYGLVYHFIGTSQDIYVLKGGNKEWQLATNTQENDGKYHANRGARWSFTAFGDRVIAVNKNDPPQIFRLNASQYFENLKGDPPKAAIVKVWGDFLCLMQLDQHPNRVYWSGLNDIECWKIGEKSCDYQDFHDGGKVQGSNEDANPIILLENSIYKASFLPGSEMIFNFQKIHKGRGARNTESIASRSGYIFFADKNGFFQIGQDGVLHAVGLEKVDRSFFPKINQKTPAEIYCSVDPIFNRVYWTLAYHDSHFFKEVLVYDFILGKWTFLTFKSQAVFSGFRPGYTLKDLDALYGNLDAVEYSLDDPCWKGALPMISVITDDGCLGFFTGKTSLDAEIYSAIIGTTDGTVLRVKKGQPILDSSCYITVYRKNYLSNFDKENENKEASKRFFFHPKNKGSLFYNFRARFFKIKITIPSNGEKWTRMKGFDIEILPSGKK